MTGNDQIQTTLEFIMLSLPIIIPIIENFKKSE